MGKQYHFRLDDDVLVAALEHELRERPRAVAAMMADLLRAGLEVGRSKRNQDQMLVYQGSLANPGRVIYGDGHDNHPQAEGGS